MTRRLSPEEGSTIEKIEESDNRYFGSLAITVLRSCPKPKTLRLISTTLLIIGLLVATVSIIQLTSEGAATPEVFVGIDIGYGDEEVALKLIDQVADYVNLIILGSLNVTTDTETLTRICDYIYQRNLHFIVYVGFGESYTPPRGPDSQFFSMAANRWGDKFLGGYFFDEPGGKLMDGAHSINITAAEDYTEAASIYTHHLQFYLGNTTEYYSPAEFKIFTSDYALYWYDYLSGYDVVLTEYVGNQSRQIATDLCRGAAKTQNKEWGAIITWSNELEPLVEDPDQLYSDMVLAYQNGAKYIVVFNSPGRFPPCTEYGTLTLEHFEVMKKFWNYMRTEPPVENYPAHTAYVLPRDYGYGFRGPSDKIWGKQEDSLAPKLWNDVNSLLSTYVLNLDIVYETKIEGIPINLPYDKLIFWNGTIIEK